ncbi:hypothetical protein ACHAWT_000416 [Skeletonema menzelii]
MDASGKNKRATMIRPVVGKVKSAQYALPDIVYGIESKMDKEGAGKVIESWSVAEPSPLPISMQSFPATNRQALKNGCLTSKAQREYGKQHPVMKQNPKRSNMGNQAKENAETKSSSNDVITSIYQRNLNQQPHQVFGIQTKKNDASMDELLRCIPSELEEETDYPDLSGKKRKGRIPPAKATKASRSVAECRPKSDRDVAKIKAVEEFKMKKFLNVQSKVKCYM